LKVTKTPGFGKSNYVNIEYDIVSILNFGDSANTIYETKGCEIIKKTMLFSHLNQNIEMLFIKSRGWDYYLYCYKIEKRWLNSCALPIGFTFHKNSQT